MSVMIIRKIYMILIAHFLGDYVLQTDFLASTKGENWYHLLIHSFLYSLPFALWFGIDWRIIILIFSHFLIDAAKSRYCKINYTQDQVLHLIVLEYLYLLLDYLWML